MENTHSHLLIAKERKEQKEFLQQKQQKKILNRFLFFWLCFIYVQDTLASIAYSLQKDSTSGVRGIVSITGTSPLAAYLLQMKSKSLAGTMAGPMIGVLFPLVAFTLLMALQACLHWWVLFAKSDRRSLWLYFLLQAACIWLIYVVADTANTVLGLCLMLAIEAIILLTRLSRIIAAVAGCLFCYMATQGLNLLLVLQSGQTIQAVVPKLIGVLTENSTLIPFVCASLVLYIQQTRARQRDQALLRELETAHIQLEDYAARVQDLTLTTERQRMARELHDTLAQGLVGLTMQLETIDSLLIRQRCEQARTLVQQAMTRSRATITSARAAITDLRTETPTTGDILVAIEAEADHFTTATGIPCTCCLQTKFPGEYHEHLLRMVSEGLTNIARHAQASQAWIRAGGENAAIILEIGDNGIGFDPAKVTTGHYGLLGLRERARLMNGQLLISSEPGKGTIVRLCLSLERGGEDGRKAG